MSINKEAFEIWVEALESGEFSKTTGVLHDEYGYCCLGVACVKAIENGVELYVEGEREDGWSYDGEGGSLPPKVMDWLGVDECDPMLRINLGNPDFPEVEEAHASDVNDNFGYDFPRIAAAIRRTYLEEHASSTES